MPVWSAPGRVPWPWLCYRRWEDPTKSQKDWSCTPLQTASVEPDLQQAFCCADRYLRCGYRNCTCSNGWKGAWASNSICSHKLKLREQKYAVIEKECPAIVWVLAFFMQDLAWHMHSMHPAETALVPTREQNILNRCFAIRTCCANYL